MNEEVRITIRKSVLDRLAETLKVGVEQKVVFDADNAVMANRAAALSKKCCSDALETIKHILEIGDNA